MSTRREEPLSGSSGDVREKVEELASGQDLPEYLAGLWFRELAVQLAMTDGVAVSALSYELPSPGQELEVTLASAPDCGSVTIGRNKPGQGCLPSIRNGARRSFLSAIVVFPGGAVRETLGGGHDHDRREGCDGARFRAVRPRHDLPAPGAHVRRVPGRMLPLSTR